MAWPEPCHCRQLQSASSPCTAPTVSLCLRPGDGLFIGEVCLSGWTFMGVGLCSRRG